MLILFILTALVSIITICKFCESVIINYLIKKGTYILNQLSIDEYTNNSLAQIVKTQTIKLLNDETVDEEIVKLMQVYFERIINSDQLRQSINDALKLQVESLLKEQWFHLIFEEKVKDIVTRACDDDVIKAKLTESFEEILDELLKSPKTKKTVNDALTDMVNDDEVQKLIGMAIRTGTKNAVTGIFY
jgi:hypothetical protein